MNEDIDKIKKVTNENLVKIALFFETTLGYPHEFFIDKVNKLGSLLDQMKFVINFYEKHKKWAKKNGIIVMYDEMIK